MMLDHRLPTSFCDTMESACRSMPCCCILAFLGRLPWVAVLDFFILILHPDSFIRSVNDLLMKIGILLPNSRKTEMEADHIGLLLMAAACYDPKHAISFWHRMDKAAKSDSHGQSEKNTTIGQFLSTHPSHGRRSDHLEEKMPMAIRIWEKANCDEQVNPFWQRFRYGSGSPGGWSQW